MENFFFMQSIVPEPVAIEPIWLLIGPWHRQMGLPSSWNWGHILTLISLNPPGRPGLFFRCEGGWRCGQAQQAQV
jgi:hypothetical protein